MRQQTPFVPFQQQVRDRLGVLPNFFCSAASAPGLIEELWAFAQSAYLDNPLPALFKERLFVYLSRFCPIRYCIVRHVGFLMGLGRPAGDAKAQPQALDQVMQLLQLPLPDTHQLNQIFSRLETQPDSATMPGADTQAETDLLAVLAVLFLEPRLAGRARGALKGAYDEPNFERLTAYLAFIRTAHYWTETHPELAYEPDMLALMEQHPSLGHLLLDPSEAEQVQQGEALRQTLANLQQARKALHQSQLRDTFLLQLSDALRPLADAQAMYDQAARLLGEFLEASRVGFAEVQPETELVVVTRQYCQGVPPLAGSYDNQAYGSDWLEQLRQGKTVASPPIDPEATLPQAQPEMNTDRQVGALVNVPLLKRGRLEAILFVHLPQPHPWSTDELTMIAETAERTWAAVERAKAEEALRESEKRFQSIANLVPDLLWDSDLDGATNWYNQQWFAYTGQQLDEAIGLGWTDATHPDDRDASARRYGEAVAAGTSLRQEHRIRRYDGVYRWFVVSATPLKDQTGQVVKMYGAATDIHELKHLEATLLDADRRKDEYLAMLAHELRNPLTPVRNGLQLLTQTPTEDPLLGTLLPIMNRQMDHIMRMMDDLLDVSRISRGKIELHPQRMDMNQVVAQTLDAMQPLYRGSGRQLTAHLPDYPIYLNGDATRIHQVVTNLLTNGLRYTPEEGQVWLSLEQVGQEARLRVRDNGIGLAADQVEAIFELFVQVDHSLARSQGGLGLGLSLVQQLVHLHGGRVEAHSQGLGQGSEFVVTLPILIP